MATAVLSLDALLSPAAGLAALRDQCIVIKVGGSIQDDPAQMRLVARDAALLAATGAQITLVHGGGKAISAAMKEAGLTPRFVAGQRYTDAPTLRIAERVLARRVNAELVAMLNEAGAQALGLHSLGTCVLGARRTTETGKPDEPHADLGNVGRVPRDGVNTSVLRGLLLQGIIPVLAPVAIDLEPGENDPGKLNVNADLAAGTVAAALGASRFVLVSDTAGIRTDPARPETALAHITRGDIDGLVRSGAIDGGMLPKVQACLEAIDAGARRVCIVDGRAPLATLAAALDHPATPGTWVE